MWSNTWGDAIWQFYLPPEVKFPLGDVWFGNRDNPESTSDAWGSFKGRVPQKAVSLKGRLRRRQSINITNHILNQQRQPSQRVWRNGCVGLRGFRCRRGISLTAPVMLGVLCARHKPWILATLSFVHGSATHHHLHLNHHHLLGTPIQFNGGGDDHRRRHHSRACRQGSSGGGAASIWHAILPSGGDRRSSLRPALLHDQKGEGSWNVAWDARPARWLHRPDSAWLLFGVCACLAPLDSFDVDNEVVAVDDKIEGCNQVNEISDENNNSSADYRVTGSFS